ncbi:MAG: hypothetical protein AAFY60_11945, partial [Myxococcota bacterium]
MMHLLLLSAFTAGTAVTTQASVSSSLRAGQIASLSARSETGSEVVLEPALDVELARPRDSLRLRASGRLSRLDLSSQEQGFARGGIRLDARRAITRREELLLSFDANGGTLDFRQATTFLGATSA